MQVTPISPRSAARTGSDPIEALPDPLPKPPGRPPGEPIIIKNPPRPPEVPEIEIPLDEDDPEMRKPPDIIPEKSPPPAPWERAARPPRPRRWPGETVMAGRSDGPGGALRLRNLGMIENIRRAEDPAWRERLERQQVMARLGRMFGRVEHPLQRSTIMSMLSKKSCEASLCPGTFPAAASLTAERPGGGAPRPQRAPAASFLLIGRWIGI